MSHNIGLMNRVSRCCKDAGKISEGRLLMGIFSRNEVDHVRPQHRIIGLIP